LLPFGLALERSTDRGGRFNEHPVDDISRRPHTAVTSVDQLDNADGSKEAKRSEFEQSFGFLDLAVLDPKSIALQAAEYFLDAPAQPIEAHDVLGVGARGDGQPPLGASISRASTRPSSRFSGSSVRPRPLGLLIMTLPALRATFATRPLSPG